MQKLGSKWGFFCVFFTKMFGLLAKRPYLCTRKRERAARRNNFFHVSTACLGYGVMVTLQILVLPFLVRVRVAQQRQKGFFGKRVPFFFMSRHICRRNRCPVTADTSTVSNVERRAAPTACRHSATTAGTEEPVYAPQQTGSSIRINRLLQSDKPVYPHKKPRELLPRPTAHGHHAHGHAPVDLHTRMQCASGQYHHVHTHGATVPRSNAGQALQIPCAHFR